MGTVPGPIIQVRISQPELSGAVQPALQQVRQQSLSISNSIADDWKRLAAQIRASMAQGLSTDKETLQTRTNLIGVLDKQISGYRQLNELSTKQLSSLKAMTLERERRRDALRRGVGVGTTAGTSSALNQVSFQTVQGIERALDSIINRFFGGAAGAAARTIRDVGYYGSLANRGGQGAAGAEGAAQGTGIFSGFSSGLSTVFGAIPSGVLAVSGLTAAFAGLAAVGITVTKSLAETAQTINNTAAATGLTTTQ